MLNCIQGLFSIPVFYCDKCKFPTNSTSHEIRCDELAQKYERKILRHKERTEQIEQELNKAIKKAINSMDKCIYALVYQKGMRWDLAVSEAKKRTIKKLCKK